MLKNYLKVGLRLSLCAILLGTSSVFGRIDLNTPEIYDGPLPSATTFSETFENIGASSSVFTDFSWTGDEGIFFVATDAKTDGTINGRAITVRDGQVVATDILGGIANITITTQGEIGSGTGTLDILVNSISVGTVPYDATVQTTTITGLNLEGFFDLQIAFPGTDNVKIDDLSWACYQIPPALLFSQYVETDGGPIPKGVEVWNNTGSTIDFSLDNLVIEKGTNGSAPTTDFTLSSGTLEDGKVIVVGTADMGTYLDDTFGAGSIQYALKPFVFSGDDALVLKLDGEITDMIGIAGNDPGTEWSGSGVSTKDQNISLLSVIEGGSPAGFTDPSTRFSAVSIEPSEDGGLRGFGLAPNEASYVIASASDTAVQCADFDVLVSIINGGDVNTVETYLTFDPSLVQVEAITAPGGTALPDASTLSQVALPIAFDNSAGTIIYAASSPTLITDDFDLMKITFSAVTGTGTSVVDVVLTGSPRSRIATTGLVGGVFVATDLDVSAFSEGITLTPDLEIPFFACVSGPNEDADPGTCTYTVQGNQYDPIGAEDNCGIASIINDYNNTSTLAGEPFTDGTAVTWTVTDVNGNFGQCNFIMTVEDAQNPVAACQGITVQLDASGMASITPGDIDDGSTDNCGIDNLSLDISSFTCANVGANTVTLTVTDAAGNDDTCTAIVTVEDNVAPFALCQDITLQLDSTGNATILADDIDNGSNDACGIASLSIAPSSFSCSELGANTVTLTVTDNNGNVSICTATVTVQDNVDPETPVLASITAECSATLVAPTTTDNCAGTITGTTTDPTSYSAQGSFTVTWNFDDGNGNNIDVAQNVIIDDVTAPAADVTSLSDATAECSATVTAPTATDNCEGVITATTTDPLTYNNQGTFTVTWTYDDGNGNTSSQIQTVIVDDVTAPAITCAANDSRSVNQINDTYLASGAEFDATAADNCLGVVSISHNAGVILTPQVGPNNTSLDGWEFPVGTSTITFTATDVEGNESTCTVEVTADNVEVSGTITLNGACLPLDMTISLYEPGTPNPAPVLAGTFADITIDPSGDFNFDASGIVSGSYDVYIKVDRYLTEFVGNYTISNSATGITGSGFRPGDISLDDDIINGIDLSLLISAYNTIPADAAYDDRADLNCDDVVDALDLSLLIFFYLDEGDSPISE
jgi:hypothetical protein